MKSALVVAKGKKDSMFMYVASPTAVIAFAIIAKIQHFSRVLFVLYVVIVIQRFWLGLAKNRSAKKVEDYTSTFFL